MWDTLPDMTIFHKQRICKFLCIEISWYLTAQSNWTFFFFSAVLATRNFVYSYSSTNDWSWSLNASFPKPSRYIPFSLIDTIHHAQLLCLCNWDTFPRAVPQRSCLHEYTLPQTPVFPYNPQFAVRCGLMTSFSIQFLYDGFIKPMAKRLKATL